MANKQNVDVAIIVPKEDELRALAWAFDMEMARLSPKRLDGGTRYYTIALQTKHLRQPLTVSVIFMQGQGCTPAAALTHEVMLRLAPKILFLFGTAVGRRQKVDLGSVVVSEKIIDLQESRIEKRSQFRPKDHDPPTEIRGDVETFIGWLSRRDWQAKLMSMPRGLFGGDEPPLNLWFRRLPKAHYGFIASGNELLLNPRVLKRVWSHDDRIRCYEMESGGFGEVAKRSGMVQWLVVRGISDYGTPKSKTDINRVAAAASAGVFLRSLLEDDLRVSGAISPTTDTEPRINELRANRVEEALRQIYIMVFGFEHGYRLSLLVQDPNDTDYIKPVFRWKFPATPAWRTEARFRKGYIVAGLAWEEPGKLKMLRGIGPFRNRAAMEDHYIRRLGFRREDARLISDEMIGVRDIACIGLIGRRKQFLAVLSIDSVHGDLEERLSEEQVVGAVQLASLILEETS